mmetsp:Transcript_15360/g.49341  ORF Transcript_15360/g.49341 Transcript_15360/m.49341 type:complete len:205 (-) Transcript_15360:390-1004(-)
MSSTAIAHASGTVIADETPAPNKPSAKPQTPTSPIADRRTSATSRSSNSAASLCTCIPTMRMSSEIRPDRLAESSTPRCTERADAPRARADERSRLCGTVVVPTRPRATSYDPAGMVGTRPPTSELGTPLPPITAAKQTIIAATTAEKRSDRRCVEPATTIPAHRGPSSTLMVYSAASSVTTSRTAAIVPAKLFASYAQPPNTT